MKVKSYLFALKKGGTIDGELIGGADELEAWLNPGHTKAA